MPTRAKANPHFDEGILVWSDEFSGSYAPPGDYARQFDEKWRLVLEDPSGQLGFNDGPGVRLDDDSIDRLVQEWIGPAASDGRNDSDAQDATLTSHVDPSLIKGRPCVDIGCGMGRWTRVMQVLGASEVLSVDAANHAVESVSRFNPNVLQADVVDLLDTHPELAGRFAFANLWGVAHHTHDPRAAFMSAAQTVAPGGAFYLMVYSPEGLHNSDRVNLFRKVFNDLQTTEERLSFVRAIHRREWHSRLPITMNSKNVLRNALRRPRWGRVIGLLDMMLPWYNWTIPLDVATGWLRDAGFQEVTVLNEDSPNRVAHHVLGSEKTA